MIVPHKPEVEGSSPSLDTILIIHTIKTTINTDFIRLFKFQKFFNNTPTVTPIL